jgi:hypothetical protein
MKKEGDGKECRDGQRGSGAQHCVVGSVSTAKRENQVEEKEEEGWKRKGRGRGSGMRGQESFGHILMAMIDDGSAPELALNYGRPFLLRSLASAEWPGLWTV